MISLAITVAPITTHTLPQGHYCGAPSISTVFPKNAQTKSIQPSFNLLFCMGSGVSSESIQLAKEHEARETNKMYTAASSILVVIAALTSHWTV